MNKYPGKQNGASAIVTIIILAVLGFGIYVGIQYVPQIIEAKSIDSIFDTIETNHKMEPVSTEYEARTRVVKLLQINEMNEMIENLSVKNVGRKITIKISYDRELNLIYKKQPMHYEKILIL